MNILPRILYVLQTVPINLPPSFFKTYKKLCRNFIWAHKPPRFSWDRMTLPKPKGGLGLPDIHKYYTACHLTRVIDWHIHTRSKDWIALEDSCDSIPLSNTPWLNNKVIPRVYSNHPLIGPTLHSFKTTCQSLTLTPTPGPMTPLTNNPDFPPGVVRSNTTNRTTEHPLRAHHFFDKGSIIPFSALAAQYPDRNIFLFHFYK